MQITTRIVIDKAKLDRIRSQFPDMVERLVLKQAGDCEAKAKRSMEGIKSGRVYGSHVASAPGEAPAVDTGELKNSINHYKSGAQEATCEAGTDHAAPLEFGSTRLAHQPNNGARPFMLPAAMQVAKETDGTFIKEEIERA